MNLFYYTLSKQSIVEYKDKGSKFIALANYTESKDVFKKQLQEVKHLHPKATHYCYAYSIGINQIVTKSSDDGEPSGSAGKPILNQINIKNLSNTSVIVVRYFGGTLLGVAGFIEAYKNVTSMALQTALIEKKQIEKKARIEFEYAQMNKILGILKKYQCPIIENQTGLFGNIITSINLSSLKEVETLLGNDPSIKIIWI